MRGQKGVRERAEGKAEDLGVDPGAEKALEGTDGRCGQEGLGQGLRGRAFRRGGVGRKERQGCGGSREGLCLAAASQTPDSRGSSFLQIPEEVGVRKDPRFHPSLNQPQRLLQPGGLRRAWGDR